MRGLTTLLACCLTAAALAGTSTAAEGPAIVVDDDGVQCAERDFADLPTAVAAAEPGSTVVVCAGAYRAAVVDKPLRLVGSGGPAAVRRGDTSREAVIVTRYGIELRADGVALEGFTFAGAEFPITLDPAHSGYVVRGNTVMASGTAIRLGGSGELRTVVEGNVVRRSSWGIQGSLSNASLVDNEIRSDYGPSVTLYGSEMTGNAFQPFVSAITVQATYSTVRGNTVNGGVGGVDVLRAIHSTFSENVIGAGGGVGIRVRWALHTSFERNRVAERVDGIVLLGGGKGTTVTANEVTDGRGDGIVLAAARGVEVADNTMLRNAGIGLLAGIQAEDNILTQNTSLGSGVLDCADETATGGRTLNLWRANVGETSSPRGICRPPSRP